MIKVIYDNYDHSDESYEKEIEGNLPKGVKSVEAAYDGMMVVVVVFGWVLSMCWMISEPEIMMFLTMVLVFL